MSSRAERARGQLYGRRKGPKLRSAQADLLTSLLPALTVEPAQAHQPRTCFGVPVDDVWLEVGFGAGEHLYALAQTNPHVGLIGAEPFVNGVAKLLSKLKDDVDIQQRVRIHMGDARDILAALPGGSLSRVMVLFPDPWPKTRHHKRRFIQMAILDAIAAALRPGGQLRFASDNPQYVAWTLERVLAHDAFFWAARRKQDWSIRPADWPSSRYEAKALCGPPCYFVFERR
ncbi:MAG: tRNA (guanosine(46)-N7)-methyltransferase TrmB [Alphaproteobacteria bacterium]|nr:tRNA (guanosine(46)-N7)-methyltransferase TrmB [Alphaproteobacteria bacterium]